jgi:hypothetical protein
MSPQLHLNLTTQLCRKIRFFVFSFALNFAGGDKASEVSDAAFVTCDAP